MKCLSVTFNAAISSRCNIWKRDPISRLSDRLILVYIHSRDERALPHQQERAALHSKVVVKRTTRMSTDVTVNEVLSLEIGEKAAFNGSLEGANT